MKTQSETYKAVFYAVANGYKPISHAVNLSEQERLSQKFKSLDINTGNIYLIEHPDAWRSLTTVKKETVFYRQPPQLLFTFEQAKKEMQRLSAGVGSTPQENQMTLSNNAGF